MSTRPEPLFPLFAGLDTLTGIGPKTAQHFAGLGVIAPRDLLFTLPQSGIDRQLIETVEGAPFPTTLTVAVTIGKHYPPRNKGGAYRIHVEDSETSFQLVFFHARGNYWEQTLPEGSRRIVSGRVELFDSVPQMVHPDFTVPEDEADSIPRFEPVYPLTQGVTQKLMYKATRGAIALIPPMGEWIDPSQLKKAEWPDFSAAVSAAHDPASLGDIAATAPAGAFGL